MILTQCRIKLFINLKFPELYVGSWYIQAKAKMMRDKFLNGFDKNLTS